MKSEKSNNKRTNILNTIVKNVLRLQDSDPFLEAVTVIIKFKPGKRTTPVFFNKTLSSLKDVRTLIQSVNKALDFTKEEHKRDASLNELKLVLTKNKTSNRQGLIFKIDLTK
ncbi:hypothetical protein KFZ70_04230 [Tamlana fucoidanivorans]|uniref:Uncharacterized protein n=1 Tax=Allotamlana fucoidanivorans TaxID=2583814 RepID=A0A5C4SDC2_9FLAO|nr:hypothetical protein [Tamlana fucoidanivorans]TNJ41349.1 hypothetical protein FGF67_16075 [Tamlana fucoidanivorans]